MQHAVPPDISLVILCYKSQESIIEFVRKVHELFSWTKIQYELILVGNYWPGQDDRTPQIVQKLARDFPKTRAVTLEKQGNMGWDLRTGFQLAQGNFVGFIDGDGQFPIDSLLPLIYHAGANQVDLAKTYRVVRGDGIYRLVISFLFNTLFRFLFRTPYRDVNSKPKIMRKSLLDRMELQSSDWFIDAEIMIKAHKYGARVIELPIHFVENQQRISFVKPQAILEFLRNLWSSYLKYK